VGNDVSNPGDMRGFLRDLLLDPDGRALIAHTVGNNERVMMKAMELASDNAKSEDGGTVLPVSVSVRILNAVAAMPADVRLTFAETGKLPERYWEQPWAKEEK